LPPRKLRVGRKLNVLLGDKKTIYSRRRIGRSGDASLGKEGVDGSSPR
jgi:hypothetical protein